MSQEPRQALNIVILGASFAGLSAAHHFLHQITNRLKVSSDPYSTKSYTPAYRVILVSPSTHLFWNIGAPRALVSESLVPLSDCFTPIAPGFAKYKPQHFAFVHGTATYLDTAQRTVTVSLAKPHHSQSTPNGETRIENAHSSEVPTYSEGIHKDGQTQAIPYHALILATGSSAKSPLLSLHGTHEKTSAALSEFHARVDAAETIMIVGGGPSGVECAGQLATYYNRRTKPAGKTQKAGALLERTISQTTNSAKRTSSRLKAKRRSWASGSSDKENQALHEKDENGEEEPKRVQRKRRYDPNRPVSLVSQLSSRASSDINAAQSSKRASSEAHGKSKTPPSTNRHSAAFSSDTAATTEVAASSSTLPAKTTTPTPAHTPVIPKKTITLVSGNERLLPRLSPSVSTKAERKLRKLGVRVVHKARLLTSKTTASGTTTCLFNNDLTVRADLFIEATGVVPNTSYCSPDILDAAGYVITDPEYLRVYGAGDRVYALGDCASYSKNYTLDVYDAVPILLQNMRNDLLAYQWRLVLERIRVPSPLPSPLPSSLPSLPSRLPSTAAVNFAPSPASSTTPAHSATADNSTTGLRAEFEGLEARQGMDEAARRKLRRHAQSKLDALDDAIYVQNPTDTQLMPMTRWGGVGVVFDMRIPSWSVHLFKGRDYKFGQAKKVVQKGHNPYAYSK